MDKQLHSNHRKRMKDKFVRCGTDVLEDHELLETLLYYAQPRVDTNPTAHRLLLTFGSLNGVLDAPHESLCAVEGMGENSATLIRLCRELTMRAQQQESARLKKVPRITNGYDAVRFFKSRYIGLQKELVMSAYLDNSCRVIAEWAFPPGQVNRSDFDIRTIIGKAINVNAASVVIAHNHPNGTADPSDADRSATYKLLAVLHSMHMTLFDHVIFGENGTCCSMREEGYLKTFGD